MVSLRNALFFSFGLANAHLILKRDVTTVLNDIANISSQTDGLTSALAAYNGGVLNAVPIVTAANNLGDAINKGTSDANAVASASAAEQSQLLVAAENLLPGIYKALQGTVDKKSQFAADGLSQTVTNTLNTLKTDTSNFGAALVAKATGDYKTAAQALVNEILAAFDAAIAGNTLPATTPIPVPPATTAAPTPTTTPAPVITTTTPVVTPPPITTTPVVTPTTLTTVPKPTTTPPTGGTCPAPPSRK